MSSEPFWSNIARDLRSKPGIGELTYPLGNYSTVEFMRWTLHRLRARDRWAPLLPPSSSPSPSLLSYDVSSSIQFHSRLISGGQKLYGAELLRGGRWLFTMRLDGTAHILDLEERESLPEPQLLFHSHHNRDHGPYGEAPLVKFRIWIDETKPELVFRVATYPGGTSRKGPVYIYQIDCAGQGSSTSWVVRPTTIIRDPRPGVRAWTALSERYFLQCFALSEANVQYTAIQLHRCYRPPELNLANHYTETRVETNGLTKAFFVPGDRVMFMASTFINIYAINLDQDSIVPELVLLHHVPILQTTSLLSAPFVGSDSTFLVGLYKGSFRRITINHNDDHTSSSSQPIIIEELGELNIPTTLSSDVVFGPSASIFRIPETSKFEIVTYEYGVDRANFKRQLYDPSDFVDDLPLSVTKYLGGFDDSIGRIVLRAVSTRDQLMVLDLI